MNNYTMIASARKTHERAMAENIGISERQIRLLCKTGKIKAICIGNRWLINWDNLLEYLSKGDQGDSEQCIGLIRRIEA